MTQISKSNQPQQTDISLLDFIQKSAVIGTWEYDVKKMHVTWSDETRKIHEMPQDYKPNVEAGLLFYKEGFSRNTITKLFTNSIEKHQKFDTELQIITGNGKEKWIRSIGVPIIENNECIKVQGLFQDIDEKKKNTELIAFKEEQLRNTFENALVGMAILDLNGKWLQVNRSLCKMFGYTESELKQLSFTDLTHPEDKLLGVKAMKNMVNGTIDNFETEKRYIDKNGHTIWALLSSSIVRNDKGEPQHFVAQLNDLTSAKENKNKIEELLNTTKQQNNRLLNFAHIVSHNLRSHYGNLDMLLDIIKMDLPETTENEVFPLLGQAVQHLGDTVNNLNEVATINLKRIENMKSINLLHTVEKIISSLSGQIISSDSKYCIDIDPSINVKGVPAYLDSIILNFLTNAIKYKKPNEPAKIELEAHFEENNVILNIKDYGLGINLKLHGNKLFGMYKTFHNHKDSRGLGLFITKNQIEAIGGTIEVESEVNVGTTFSLKFNKYEEN